MDSDELLRLNHTIKDLTKTARLQYQTYIRMPTNILTRRREPKITASKIVVVVNGRRMRKKDVLRGMKKR